MNALAYDCTPVWVGGFAFVGLIVVGMVLEVLIPPKGDD